MKRIIKIILVLIIVVSVSYSGFTLYKLWVSHSQVKIDETAFRDDRHGDGTFTITPPSLEDVVTAKQDLKGYWSLLSIKGVINSPIWRGMSDYAMYRGGSTYREDMELGKDNLVILGHNMWDGSLFGGIHKAKLGETITLYDGKYLYNYKIIENREGTADEGHYLNSFEDDKREAQSKGIEYKEGKPRVTLITCIGSYGTPYRRFVVGEFTDKKEPTVKELKELGWGKPLSSSSE